MKHNFRKGQIVMLNCDYDSYPKGTKCIIQNLYGHSTDDLINVKLVNEIPQLSPHFNAFAFRFDKPPLSDYSKIKEELLNA